VLNSPSLILSLILATLYAMAFHFLWGQTWKQLLVSWLAAVGGFFVGQVLASLAGWRDLTIGQVRLLSATTVAWLCLVLARRLRL